MTRKEATRIAEIAVTADRRCPFCAASLMELLIATFPEHDAIFSDHFYIAFGRDWKSYV